MPGKLEGKTVLISGGGTGIGAAIAHALAIEGASIALCGRRIEKLEAAAARLPGRTLCLPCDVKDEAQVRDVVQSAAGSLGRLDILVNNAGIFDMRPLEETSADFFDEVHAVNLRGAFLMAQAAWPHLKQSQGQIVNLSSVSGTRGFRNCSAYCASKFGLNGLSEVLSLEGKEHGIRVFSVCPGAVETPLWEGPGSKGGRESDGMEGNRKAIADSRERSRMMEPEAVANLVCWLVASDRRVELSPLVIVNYKDPWARE